MPDDINELDVNDIGLKQMFGERFHDETDKPRSEPVTVEPKKVSTNTTPIKKTAQSDAGDGQKAKEAQWEPVKERNWMDNLRECARAAVTFGGLNLLIFYWQQVGLMDSSVAVPSMCVCACLMGLGIGKVVGGKKNVF